jgi:DNA-binding Xre family transcriptional regulator
MRKLVVPSVIEQVCGNLCITEKAENDILERHDWTDLCDIDGFDSNHLSVLWYVNNTDSSPASWLERCCNTVDVQLNQLIVSCYGQFPRSWNTFDSDEFSAALFTVAWTELNNQQMNHSTTPLSCTCKREWTREELKWVSSVFTEHSGQPVNNKAD